MSKIKASFLCPTYGRAARQPHIIAEMLYWVTKQTIWDQCELVILNDAANQTLVCSVPRVRVINKSKRYPTLGEKMNALVEFAQGDICLVSEDDDISLPHRAEQALSKLEGYDFWKPGYFYYAEGSKPLHVDPGGVQHNCSAYRRHAVIGRYPKVTVAHDSIVQSECLRCLNCNPNQITPDEISFIYRWGCSDLHLSAFHPNTQQVYDEAYPGPPGNYLLKPVMGKDYQAMHEEMVRNRREQTPTLLGSSLAPLAKS